MGDATHDVVEYLDRDLPDLLALLRASDVRELELREGDISIRVHRVAGLALAISTEAPPPAGEPEGGESPLAVIASPLVGTFYGAATPGIPPLVSEGSTVTDETLVGYVEVLGETTEIEAGVTGEIVQVLATDGQPVEYGQVLFEVVRGG